MYPPESVSIPKRDPDQTTRGQTGAFNTGHFFPMFFGFFNPEKGQIYCLFALTFSHFRPSITTLYSWIGFIHGQMKNLLAE